MLSGKTGSALVLVILSILIVSGFSGVTALPNDLQYGPFVDRIVYKVIENDDQRYLALQAGEIEMDMGFFDPARLPTLAADPDIDIFSALRNGYGHITINCRDYPLNISGFRRAFAFAFDKTAVTVDVFDGFSQEHDSVVPFSNGWCIENDFDWDYYTDRSDIGNQILDDLGFEINGTTGFRDAPNGESFDILIEYGYDNPFQGGDPDWISSEIASIGVDALHALHIDANMNQYSRSMPTLEEHGNYDMVVYSKNFYDNNVDWLAYEYWSEYADVYDENPSNFQNDTYDSWRDQLLHGTTLEEVYEAAAEMQKILHYNVPRLVVYENTYLQGYRNDQFTGHVGDLGRYISGLWTMRKIQKLDGTFGGTVAIAISGAPDNFNIYRSESVYSAAIFDNLYSSLYRQGPDLSPVPDLARTILTETHDDNPAVPEGHTRFTIDIIQNAIWSDGTDLTASDVAFTYSYQFESAAYGNPAGQEIGNIVAAYAPTQYIVVLEFNTESYWHFSTFAYDYIIPEHIFNNDDGIGCENWYTWNPVLDPAEPQVTCGPYVFADYEQGEFYELTYNPLFHYDAGSVPRPPDIHSQGDITYWLGSLGNEILWTVYGTGPCTYSIHLNGIEREVGEISNHSVRHNIDGLGLGSHTFTLNVTNFWGLWGTNTVQVRVVNHTGDIPTNPLAIIAISISSVSAVVILAATIAIYRNKRILETA